MSGLAVERAAEQWSLVNHLAEENTERLLARENLALALCKDARYEEADAMLQEVLTVRKRVQGEEHADTLNTAGTLASSLLRQERNAEAEVMLREVLAAKRRVHGEESEKAIVAAGCLAACLARLGMHAEAEVVEREVLAVISRMSGAASATEAARTTGSDLRDPQGEQFASQPSTAGATRLDKPTPKRKSAGRGANKVSLSSPVLSPAAFREADAKAKAAEAELMRMLEQERAPAHSGAASKSNRKAKSKKTGGHRIVAEAALVTATEPELLLPRDDGSAGDVARDKSSAVPEPDLSKLLGAADLLPIVPIDDSHMAPNRSLGRRQTLMHAGAVFVLVIGFGLLVLTTRRTRPSQALN
jgi:hypothetical protein